jgi:hypothetical protein
VLSERQIVVRGWNVGFRKVEFTQLLREECGLSLSEAKARTDAVLDGKSIELAWRDGLVEKMSALHAMVEAKDHGRD